jgi:hypothetical protein
MRLNARTKAVSAVGLFLGAALLFGLPGCEKAPLTAPSGSTIFLVANPTFVVANGGVSVVTAVITEPAGTFVPDGTEVYFFTDLGHVDNVGMTNQGQARVNFVADSRSGTATVTAISGGPAIAPSPSPSTSTGSSGFTASANTGPAVVAASTGENSTSITIDVGSALPSAVIVTANPPRITTPRQTQITANVFDSHGNPVQNVPVIFSVTANPLEETLDSGGRPIFTDSNGQAFDTLRTRSAVGGRQKQVTVTATTPTGTSNSVSVFVN